MRETKQMKSASVFSSVIKNNQIKKSKYSYCVLLYRKHSVTVLTCHFKFLGIYLQLLATRHEVWKW